MKIGFWNVNKNKLLLDVIYDFAYLHYIDLLVLFECENNPVEVLLKLNSPITNFHFYKPIQSDFVQIYTRFSTNLFKEVSDDHRLTAKQYISPLGNNINFIFLHYFSKLFYEEQDQDAKAPEVKNFIDDVEKQTKNTNTIILGDFNMNPFQKGMIATTGLHSTFDKQVALQGSRKSHNKEYKYFYNPMWSFYGEYGRGNINGTYFYNVAKPTGYHWNIFDQVLFRPSLITNIFDEASLNIVTKIGIFNLINSKGIINKEYSDHLPVEFELNNI